MAEDPPETPNYGFPLMSGATDDYVDLWHLILEDGSEETNNDGLIKPLDTIIDSIETDLDGHTTSSSAHGSNGDVAGVNDLYTDDEARTAVDGSSVSITGSAGSLSGDNVTTVNGETGDVTVDGGVNESEAKEIAIGYDFIGV